MTPKHTYVVGPKMERGLISERFLGATSAVVTELLVPRKIVDVVFSCMGTQDELRSLDLVETVEWSFARNDEVFMGQGVNVRASMRWVTLYGCEVELAPSSLIVVTVEPSYAHMNLTFCYNLEMDHAKAARCVSEVLRWYDGVLVLHETTVLAPGHLDLSYRNVR